MRPKVAFLGGFRMPPPSAPHGTRHSAFEISQPRDGRDGKNDRREQRHRINRKAPFGVYSGDLHGGRKKMDRPDAHTTIGPPE